MHLVEQVDVVGSHATGYRHEAVLWSSDAEFVRSAAAFIIDGLEFGEPVMVATVPSRLDALRRVVGARADVRFVDMTMMGANPSCIIPAWLDFLDDCKGRPARGIGEPIWLGRRDAELVECQLHEALLNLAVPPETPFWLRCPYDVRLGREVLHEAARSHPVVAPNTSRSAPQEGYAGAEHALDAFAQFLPPPPDTALVRAFGNGELRRLRDIVLGAAAGAGMSAGRAADLELAVHELATNSIRHGGGHGEFALWRERQALVCEVQDSGQCADPLVGRRSPSMEQAGGRGLWMVNQLCDLVQLRSGTQGTRVRVHSWL